LVLFPLALFDVFELLLASFELFGGRYARDGIFRALLGLLGIGFGLFKVSNTSKLGSEGMKPRITCYVIGIKVTHMLEDGRVGVHRRNCDFFNVMKLYS